jgi:molecular chaperone DnaJ
MAALGGEIEVPTPDGNRARIKIPEGAQGGHQIRLKGKGMPVLKGGGAMGDLFVELRVETPTKLNRRQKELLREFDEASKGSQPESEGFFAKMKDFLGG